MKAKVLLLFLGCILFAACEKGYVEEEVIGPTPEPRGNVTLRVTTLDIMPFGNVTMTKASQDIGYLCSRLSFVVFSGDEKVKSINQKEGDEGFGTVSMNIAEGNYTLVVIAHSCSGNATVSSPSKITFPNNVVSDTFYYCGELAVSSGSQTNDLALTRAVAMFRLKTNDAIPASVDNMKFYYTGGSSTFDATTGYGCVNSRQTVNIAVTDGMHGQPGTFEVYTFPHEETGTLKMTVTAEDAQKNAIQEKEFTNVPIQRNYITQMSGDFFNNSVNNGQAFALTADGDWGGENNLSY